MGTWRHHSSYPFLIIISILLYSCWISTTLAQLDKSLDSLYNLFVSIKSNNISDLAKNKAPNKCGMDIINQIKLNYDHFNIKQKEKIQTLLARPVLQTSAVSPSGFFRIHYDATGINTPAYISGWTVEQNVSEVANTLDSVYSFEIDFLSYPPPPPDNGAGGDNKYDIYIVNQVGLYGYTEYENKVGAVNWTSFMVIDNDYTGFYSSSINGLKVTAAHEFHHGIQLGNYSVLNSNSPYRNSDLFFYELSSTSMEEFVYDDVNDYYAYMGSYFSHPYTALPKQNGYNLCIWNLFLKERFGYDIIKRQWEMIPTLEAILSIDNSLIQQGSTLKEELNDFGIWTYFTNSRAIQGIYFSEAANYPLISLTSTISFLPPKTNLFDSAHPTANNFYKINLPSGNDFLISIITNGDVEAANQDSNQYINFTYSLFNYNETGSTPIVNNYYFIFETSDSSYWKVKHIFNDIATVDKGNVAQDYHLSQNYPNPFNPSTMISWQLPVGSWQTLKIYDVLGNEVETLVDEYKPAGTYAITWYADGLPSGIYFYQLKTKNSIDTKKMILIK